MRLAGGRKGGGRGRGGQGGERRGGGECEGEKKKRQGMRKKCGTGELVSGSDEDMDGGTGKGEGKRE